MSLISAPRSGGRLLALAAMLGTGAAASAETVNCTAIPSLPFTITAKGVYCLTADLDVSITSGNALQINASNVVLDMNGHRITGEGGGVSTVAVGIYAFQRQSVTIRNGTVQGFLVGIWLDDVSPYTASQGNVVEDVRADLNRSRGIAVVGRGCLVRGNEVLFTGWNTALGTNANAAGIYVTGAEHRVLDNDVMTVVKGGTGTAFGIRVTQGTENLIVGNRITSVDQAIAFSRGADGSYEGNVTGRVSGTPFVGGFDAGNNN